MQELLLDYLLKANVKHELVTTRNKEKIRREQIFDSHISDSTHQHHHDNVTRQLS